MHFGINPLVRVPLENLVFGFALYLMDNTHCTIRAILTIMARWDWFMSVIIPDNRIARVRVRLPAYDPEGYNRPAVFLRCCRCHPGNIDPWHEKDSPSGWPRHRSQYFISWIPWLHRCGVVRRLPRLLFVNVDGVSVEVTLHIKMISSPCTGLTGCLWSLINKISSAFRLKISRPWVLPMPNCLAKSRWRGTADSCSFVSWNFLLFEIPFTQVSPYFRCEYTD